MALSVALTCTSARAQSPDDAPAALNLPETEYATGDAPIDPAILRRLPVAPRYKGFLPIAVNLSSRMPQPGDQGKLGSCTAWAVAYAARSYYTSTLEHRDIRQTANLPSPNYIFHLARQKECAGGSSLNDVVKVLKQGALSLKDYPYRANCVPAAPPELVSRAKDFRIRGFRLVASVPDFDKGNRMEARRIDDIKGQLAQSNPVIISFNVSTEFERFKPRFTNTRAAFGEITPKQPNGWHSMTLIGYDDQRQAFRLINSWGRDWGDGGYAWVGYDVIRTRVRYAAILDVAPPAPAIARPAPERPIVPAVKPLPPAPVAIPAPVAKVEPARPVAKEPEPPAVKVEPVHPVAKPEPIKPEPQHPIAKPEPERPAVTGPVQPPVAPRQRAEIADLQGLSCAKITVQVQGDRKTLAGFVGSAADLELVKRVAADVPNTAVGDVAVAPWPQCEALLTLDTQLAAADHPKVSINARGELREGDRLRVEVQAPAQISYVYVVYIQADGSVVTLAQPRGVVPQPTLPGRTLTFGDGAKGAKFTISRPFGQEMIIVIASRSPLFEKELPAKQTEREYLSALRRALIYKPSPDMPDREVTAAMTVLRTRGR